MECAEPGLVSVVVLLMPPLRPLTSTQAAEFQPDLHKCEGILRQCFCQRLEAWICRDLPFAFKQ